MRTKAMNEDEGDRRKLSQAIIDILESWPEIDREVFSRAHYDALSPEEIAEVLQLAVEDVRMVLHDCEQKLHLALRPFREAPPVTMHGIGSHPVARECCRH